MSNASTTPTPSKRPRIQPHVCVLLNNWRYVEYSLLRVIAGWGRDAGDWEDKLAVCHHTWLQADIVDRLRKRLDMFPGVKVDGPVHAVFERLCNAVLLAPNFADAMAGVHAIMNPAILGAYAAYAATSHPIHDRPTHDLLRDLRAIKQVQSDWYEDFVRRHPHEPDARYVATIRQLLGEAGMLSMAIDASGPSARTCGVGTGFRMKVTPGRVKGWDRAPNVMPFLQAEWGHNVEARRLFFCIGYAWEMGVAEEQLRWIYYADFMPFEYVHAEARHMWDESRHGDSGRARLREFGLDLEHIGYDSYGAKGEGELPDMTPADVYQAFYRVTQVAETGYFETKRYCFHDFDEGGDDASAEMMQFDIIDETSHVEYGHKWLEEMGQRAGVGEDYRVRGRADRAEAQRKSDLRVGSFREAIHGVRQVTRPRPLTAPDALYNPANTVAPGMPVSPDVWSHYQWLLAEMRSIRRLTNTATATLRPNLPM